MVSLELDKKHINKIITKIIIILSIAFILLFINWSSPVVCFDLPIINACISLIWLCIPLLIIILLFLITDGWSRKLTILCLLPVICFTFIFGSLLTINFYGIIKYSDDPAFEKIETVQNQGYRVSIYRTDGGATTDFGIAVRQEKQIFPKLLIVRKIAMFYPADHAQAQIMKNKALIKVSPYGSKQQGISQTYTLKRFVYF